MQKVGWLSTRMCLCTVMMALLGACGHAAPEQALRDTVGELQAAIATRDADEVERFLAEDFVGNDGIDRFAARRLASGVFLRYRSVGASWGRSGSR